jgi:ATP-dependent RNA helicase RhlE
VNTAEKKDLLLQLLKEDPTPSILVFTRTKHGADRIVKILAKAQITAAAIHGNKSQNARQNALNGFKNNKLRVLVATDIAARGIDIDELELVINYDIPNIPETYVHRIGRTGRAGASGRAISFCDQDERAYVRDIQKLIGIQIPVLKNN